MATIGQMATIVADALGIDEATSKVFVRYLRDNGHLTTGGRGPSAAQMTRLDFSRALIGFLSVDRSEPRYASDAVLYFGGLQYAGVHRDSKRAAKGLDLVKGFGLSPNHTFEQAIAKLLEVYERDGDRLQKHAWGKDDLNASGFLPVLKVTVYDTTYNAEISLQGTTHLYSEAGAVDIIIGAKTARHDQPRYKALERLVARRPRAGLRTERYFTWSEIHHLLMALFKLQNPDFEIETDGQLPI